MQARAGALGQKGPGVWGLARSTLLPAGVESSRCIGATMGPCFLFFLSVGISSCQLCFCVGVLPCQGCLLCLLTSPFPGSINWVLASVAVAGMGEYCMSCATHAIMMPAQQVQHAGCWLAIDRPVPGPWSVGFRPGVLRESMPQHKPAQQEVLARHPAWN